MARSRPVGIDLGTTYSAVAWMQESGNTGMIPNAEGDILTPSTVWFGDDEILVGKEARKAGLLEPDRFAETVKRDMGSPVYSRPICGRFLPPEVIQACILRQLKSDMVQALGPDCETVITVPAFFDEPRRQATAAAGEMAGLNLIDIVNEPMAAALAFGEQLGYLGTSGAPKESMTLLVYDLGGGTFDVTLVEMQPGDVRTLATDGDVRLGGRDWDLRLADHVAQAFIEQHREDPRTNPASFQHLLGEVEEAKRTLSARQQAKVCVQHAGSSCEVMVTREQFEGLTADLLLRTAHTTREVLKAAGRSWNQVNRVLLVGGSTRMPMVGRMLESLSGIQPDRGVHPDEAVARGAAIYAHYFLCLRGDQGPAPPFEVVNVNAHSLGIESLDPVTLRKSNVILIPKNSPLPARVTKEFLTKSDGQASVAIRVLEGEASSRGECTIIGQTAITGVPPNLPKGTPVDVTYEYAANGRLSVRARLRTGLHAVNLELQRQSALSSEHVSLWKRLLRTATGSKALWAELDQQEATQATPSAASVPISPIPLSPRPVPLAAPAAPAPADHDELTSDLDGGSLPAKPQPARRRLRPQLGPLGTTLGHVLFSLLGVLIGYYILCCLLPEQYNYFNLPVPFSPRAEPPGIDSPADPNGAGRNQPPAGAASPG
jgi:molecular chaperone DnaK